MYIAKEWLKPQHKPWHKIILQLYCLTLYMYPRNLIGPVHVVYSLLLDKYPIASSHPTTPLSPIVATYSTVYMLCAL